MAHPRDFVECNWCKFPSTVGMCANCGRLIVSLPTPAPKHFGELLDVESKASEVRTVAKIVAYLRGSFLYSHEVTIDVADAIERGDWKGDGT